MISFSVAVDPKLGIGKDNVLPWHIKEELKLFKSNTINHYILMGQTTFENLPRKLVDRTVVVVSNDLSYTPSDKDALLERDLIAFLKKHENDDEEYIVCGGASIFKQAYKYAKKAYVSFIDKEYDCDTYFDGFNIDEWNILKEERFEEFTYRLLERK